MIEETRPFLYCIKREVWVEQSEEDSGGLMAISWVTVCYFRFFLLGGGGKRERESGWGLKVTWFPVQRTPCDSTPSCLSFCNLWPLCWHQNGNQLLCWWSAETSWKITTPQKKNGVSSVGCLFCLHRLTVDREEGRTMFYRLFNQCFPHKRFTQKFHRPIPDWTRIWWNLGLSLLI